MPPLDWLNLKKTSQITYCFAKDDVGFRSNQFWIKVRSASLGLALITISTVLMTGCGSAGSSVVTAIAHEPEPMVTSEEGIFALTDRIEVNIAGQIRIDINSAEPLPSSLRIQEATFLRSEVEIVSEWTSYVASLSSFLQPLDPFNSLTLTEITQGDLDVVVLTDAQAIEGATTLLYEGDLNDVTLNDLLILFAFLGLPGATPDQIIEQANAFGAVPPIIVLDPEPTINKVDWAADGVFNVADIAVLVAAFNISGVGTESPSDLVSLSNTLMAGSGLTLEVSDILAIPGSGVLPDFPFVDASSIPVAVEEGQSITLNGNNLDQAMVAIGGQIATVLDTTATSVTFTIPTGVAGSNVIGEITTPLGFTSFQIALIVVPIPAPMIDPISIPTSTAELAEVVLEGSGLTEVDSVTVGGVEATITANDETSVAFVIPEGVAGTDVDVIITTIGGSTTVVLPLITIPAPTIEGSSIPASSVEGDEVTLTGTNLIGATVTVADIPANVTETTETSITFTIPAGTAGVAVSGVITGAGGSVTVEFPEITVPLQPPILDPNILDLDRNPITSGAPGENVILTGSNLLNAIVTVNSIEASVIQENETELQIQIPEGSVGTGVILVTTPAGQDSVGFTVIDPNAISWISDSSGDWEDPNNWDLGRVPDADDTVIIDRPGVDLTVTLTGVRTVLSLSSAESLAIVGGELTVIGGATVEGAFTLTDASLAVEGSSASFTAEHTVEIEGSNLIATNGGTITLTNLQKLSNGSANFIQSEDNASLIDLPNLNMITAHYNLILRDGGSIELPSLETLTYPTVAIVVDSASLSLPALSEFETDQAAGVAISAQNGGTIDFPALQTLLSGSGQITVQGSGSAIDFPTLVSITGDYDLIALAGASLSVPALTVLNSPGTIILVDSTRVEFPVLTQLSLNQPESIAVVAQNGGEISFPSLQTLITGSAEIEAQNPNSLIDLPVLTSITSNYDLLVLDGGIMNVPALQSFRDPSAELLALGASLELPELTEFESGLTDQNVIWARENGQITLPKLQTLDTGSGDIKVEESGSEISFPALTSIGGAYPLTAQDSGTLSLPILESYTNVNAHISVTDATLNLPELTSFESGLSETPVLWVREDGTLTLPGLTNLDSGGGRLQSNGAGSQLNLPVLTSILGNYDLVLQNGGDLSLPLLSSFRNSGAQIIVTDASLTLPALTEFESDQGSSATILAQSSSILSFSILTSISTGSGRIVADGSGSLINFPQLTTLGSGYALNPINGGQIVTPNLF